jgi:hypothetical protein
MLQFTQVVGESLYYQQDVVNDTIIAAVWSVDIAGPILSGQIDAASSSKILFTQAIPGTFVLTADLELATGQTRKGQARINVIAVGV